MTTMAPKLDHPRIVTGDTANRRTLVWVLPQESLVDAFLEYLAEETAGLRPVAYALDQDSWCVRFEYGAEVSDAVIFCCYLLGRLHGLQQHFDGVFKGANP